MTILEMALWRGLGRWCDIAIDEEDDVEADGDILQL